MTTRTVTGNVKKITGAARAGEIVRFDNLQPVFTTTEHVPLDTVSTLTDASGNFSIILFCPATYRCTIGGIVWFTFVVPDSAAATTLEALHALGEAPIVVPNTLLGLLGVTLNTDGTLKSNIVGNAQMLDNSVGTTEIIDGSVTGAKWGTSATSPQSILWDIFNEVVDVGVNFLGQTRWYTSAFLTMVDAVTSGNPFGKRSLRLIAGATQGGKRITTSEVSLKTGDIVRFAMIFKCTAGATIGLSWRPFDSADNPTLAIQTVSAVSTGSDQYLASPPVALPGSTAYILVYPAHVAGPSPDLDVHVMWGVQGEYIGLYPPSNPGYPNPMSGQNQMWDTFFEQFAPGFDWGGNSRWHQPTGYTGVVFPDATNPYGGRTLLLSATASQPGRKSYPRENGIKIGEPVSYSVTAASPGGASLQVRCGFWNSAGGLITSVLSSLVVLSAVPQTLSTPLKNVPINTDYVLVTTEHSGVATPTSVYAMWGGRGGASAIPTLAPVTSHALTGEVAKNLAVVAKHELQQWRFKGTQLLMGTAGIRAVINLIGDSWFERTIIRNALNDLLVPVFGDAGSGYVSPMLGDQYQYNWTVTRTGVWVDRNILTDPATQGADGTDSTTSDLTATWNVTATVTDFVVHFRAQTGGGTLGIQVDSGAVNTYVTNGAPSYLTVNVPAGALGSHVLHITITAAGSAGVRVLGAELIKNQNGVRINKLGKGSSTTSDWAATDVTDWTTAYTALAADVSFILLGVNDRRLVVPPVTYYGNLLTMIDRLQVANPLGDIYLLSPGDTSTTTTFSTAAYTTTMRRVLTARPRVGFLNLADILGTYNDANVRGVMSDALHPNALGGQLIARAIYDILKIS